jgi:hypothetical protein
MMRAKGRIPTSALQDSGLPRRSPKDEGGIEDFQPRARQLTPPACWRPSVYSSQPSTDGIRTTAIGNLVVTQSI